MRSVAGTQYITAIIFMLLNLGQVSFCIPEMIRALVPTTVLKYTITTHYFPHFTFEECEVLSSNHHVILTSIVMGLPRWC